MVPEAKNHARGNDGRPYRRIGNVKDPHAVPVGRLRREVVHRDAVHGSYWDNETQTGFYEGRCPAAECINERNFEEMNEWSKIKIYLCANAPV